MHASLRPVISPPERAIPASATIANNAAKATAKNPFEDVQHQAYYYDAVLWAVNRGVTNGTSNTTFSPNDTCTRGQVVTFLYRDMH